MSNLKQNPLANLVRAAVGFSATNSSCCGFPSAAADATTQPASVAPTEKESAESCGCDKEAASVPNPSESQSNSPAPKCCG